MRHLLILGFLVIGLKVSFGQSYHKLLKQKVTWDVSYWQKENPWPCSTYEIRRYFIDGETEIGDKIFQKIVYQEIRAKTVICDFSSFYLDTTITHFFGYLREDTITHKVFKYNSECNKELLLYDFTVAKNDTCKVYNYDCDSASWIVSNTNLITLNDGSIVKKISNTSYYESVHNYEFIESIGNIFEPFDFIFMREFGFEGGSNLKCVIDNGVIRYGNKLFSDIKSINQSKPITLYPNPATNKITIVLGDFYKPDNIVVSNIFGEIIKLQISLSDINKVELDISDLSSGLYFLRIKSNYNVNFKFIKK